MQSSDKKVDRYIYLDGIEDFAVDLFPYKIKDPNNFYFRNPPVGLNPNTFRYKAYWKSFEKHCLEGKWINDNGTWVYLMPKLFFYLNYVQISDEKRDKIYPRLMDTVIIMFTYFLCCEGFSGFDGDEEVTCNKYVGRLAKGEKLQDFEKEALEKSTGTKKPNGEYKRYVEPWEYLTETYLITNKKDKPLGNPIYDNGYYNGMLLCSRTVGKSFNVFLGLFLHEWLFSGVKKQSEYKSVNNALNFGLAASDTKALARSVANLDRAYFSFPGQYDFPTKVKGKTVKYWGPFYKNTRGQWRVASGASEVKHIVKTKQGKTLVNGSMVQISPIVANNDKIFTGDRFRLGIIEEGGFVANLKNIFISAQDAFKVGKTPTGSIYTIGCVCAGTKVYTKLGELKNIEDLTINDGIVGYNGDHSYGQDLAYINPPQKKECLRIITSGGNTIECSLDHPFITRKGTKIITKNGFKSKVVSYYEAEELEVGDYLLTAECVDIFGNQSYEDAYLYGLMLGDGYFKHGTVSVDDENVKEYLYNTYRVKVKKNFITKDGKNYWELTVKNFRELLKGLNTEGCVRDNKFIDSSVYKFDKDSVSKLIAGIVDSDGNVYHNPKKGNRIVVTNTSLNLLESLKYLLLKFGIQSNIYKENRSQVPLKGYEGQKGYIYRLYITDNDSVEKFRDNVKLLHSKKYNTLKNFYNTDNRFKSNDFIFKYRGKCVDEEFIQDSKNLKNTYYQKIKSIEKIGLKDVYNLNALGSHNYIANGFITGNTGGDLDKIQDAKEMFEDPESFNIFPIPNYWAKSTTVEKKCGMFVGAYYKAEELKDKGNTKLKEALLDVVIDREEKRSKWSRLEFSKELSFNPIYPKELLRPTTKSPVPQQELAAWRDRLVDDKVMEKTAAIGSFKYRNGKVEFEADLEKTMTPILEWGKDEKLEDQTGAWVIHEFPPAYIPEGLYYVLYDPYTQSGEGTSMQSVLIYKHKFKHSGGDQSLQDTIVASYIGRLDTLDKAFEEPIKAALFFNAKVFPEMNSIGFAEFVDRRGYQHMMQFIDKRVLEAIKGSTAASHGRSKYGYGIKVNREMNIWSINRLANWMTIPVRKDEKTDIPTWWNYQNIRDLRLLSEAANFDFENKQDFDAMSALMLLPYLLSYLDDYIVELQSEEEAYEKEYERYSKLGKARREKRILKSKLSETI